MGSKRLPGKSLMELYGSTVLELIYERVKQSNIQNLWIATSNLKEDDPIQVVAKKLNVNCFRGSEEDVLSRFIEIIDIERSDWIVRITGDNPFTHHPSINQMIEQVYKLENIDYLSDFILRQYPIGAFPEIVRSSTLMELREKSLPAYHRSNVTSSIVAESRAVKNLSLPTSYLKNSDWRWTLDEKDDFEFFTILGKKFGPSIRHASYQEIFNFLKQNKEIAGINSNVRQKSVCEG